MSETYSSADELQSPGGGGASLKLRLSVMMFLQYFVQGCYLPVISVYLQDALGFSADEIGTFGAALALGPLAAPFIVGQMVDRHLATQHVLSFCHFAGGLIMLALYFETEFWPVVILGMVYSTLYVPSMMLTNSLSFHHLPDRDRDFPRVRLWGTLGFVVPAWVVEMYFLKGLTGDELNTGRGIVLLLAGVGGLLMGLYSLTLPHTPPQKKDSPDLAPGKVAAMLRFRYFLVLVLVSLLIAVVHKFHFVWNSPFLNAMLETGGIQGAWEQRISSIGQISEIAVMAFLGTLVIRFGFKTTMLLGAVAYVLRCLIFAAAYAFEMPFSVAMTAVCVGQAMHGFCFGCFLAAAFMYVDRVATSDIRGSMQNLYGTFVLGLGFVAGGFVAGRTGAYFSVDIGTESIRDWPAIWLTGAALAGIAAGCFFAFFPKELPDSAES